MAEPDMRSGIDVLLGKAVSLAAEDFRSIGLSPNLKGCLESLVPVLGQIRALLPDAARKAASSRTCRVWLEQVVSETSQADNFLDECKYARTQLKVEIQHKKLRKIRNFLYWSKRYVLRSKMSRKMRLIIEHLAATVGKACSLGLQSAEVEHIISAAQEEAEAGQFDSQEFESNSFGHTNSEEMLVTSLLQRDKNEDLSFIGIVGMAGIGKTRLARVAYTNAEVVNRFDERIWICVSDDLNTGRILEMMYESLTHSRSSSEVCSREGIVYKLLERLKGKNFLLVLDDVRNEIFSEWSSLKQCLLNLGGSTGSKVVSTTRYLSIARMMNPLSIIHPRISTDDDCWHLFRQIAFARECPEPLLEVSKSIARKCYGHPLTVKLIAGLMSVKKKIPSEWRMIDESLTQYVSEGSVSVNDAVGFCYDQLPSSLLKQCFLYCSIFPKDAVMEREELIRLWMAQGFLNPHMGSQLQIGDIGAKHLDHLTRTFFLQDAEEKENRRSYKMHDLLHDLALSKSTGYCSMFENEEVKDDFDAVHLSLKNCKLQMSRTLGNKISMLRTLRLVEARNLGEILAHAKLLRVLVVVDMQVEELPNSIGKLRYLSYLDISKTRIVRLPDSISKLYNLQTLRLYDLLELPRDFENLVSLTHFYVENFNDLDKLKVLPPRFQELISLSSFNASFKVCLDQECRIDKLEQVEHPHSYSSLKIYRLENVSDRNEVTKALLSKMSNIDSLRLHWSARRENCYDEEVLEGLLPRSNVKNLTIENFKGSVFPSWMIKTSKPLLLHHLVKIELENCSCCEQIPPLGHLPSLKIVRIMGVDNVKRIGAEFYGFTNLDYVTKNDGSGYVGPTIFPALREFSLKGMTSLEKWSEALHLSDSSGRVFPLLEKFEVQQCPKLKRIPDITQRGSTYLRRLTVAFCERLTHVPEGLGRLNFLEDLEIRGLVSLSQLSVGFCSKLKNLTIGGFSSTSEVNYNIQQGFDAESSLQLKGEYGKLVSLPEQLQQLSNLRYLTIWGYGGLEDLPEWLGNFQALQILKLELCGNLKYLPSSEALQKLTNLIELNICFCPLLEERCTRGSRPEWHKISHIRTIKMSHETIKSQN